jgi:hypothetical protein
MKNASKVLYRYRQTTNKEQVDKHIRKETTKITKENSTGTKHK